MLGPFAPGGTGSGNSEVVTRSEIFDLVDYEVITVNGTWMLTTALNTYVPGRAMDDIRLDIDIIGGGASGRTGWSNIAGDGGMPGSVTRLRMLHPDELPSAIPVTIGSGGAATPRSAERLHNAGGSTSFGEYSAPGGVVNLTGGTALQGASDVPLGQPGLRAFFNAPSPSYGPGAGAVGAYSSSIADAGGPAAVNRPPSSTLGGTGGTHSAPGGPGANALDAFGYGAGGGAGKGDGDTANQRGGDGGFPGGGGGGGGTPNLGNQVAGVYGGGAGGNGAVRIRYYVRRVL